MRYVAKGSSPQFFEDEKKNNLDSWDNLKCKSKLKAHLIAEQSGLCIYCEGKIDQENSHIEHLYPQSNYKKLRFEYENLVVSCTEKEEDKEKYQSVNIKSCGHKKSNSFEEHLFLNPCTITNLTEYFKYDFHNASILASDLNADKSNYMIHLLNLNNPHLLNARTNAVNALRRIITQSNNRDWMGLINNLLEKNPPFISCLRSYILMLQNRIKTERNEYQPPKIASKNN